MIRATTHGGEVSVGVDGQVGLKFGWRGRKNWMGWMGWTIALG